MLKQSKEQSKHAEPPKRSGRLGELRIRSSALWAFLTLLMLVSVSAWSEQFARFPRGISFFVPSLLIATAVAAAAVIAIWLRPPRRFRPVMFTFAALNFVSAVALYLPVWLAAQVPAAPERMPVPAIRVMTANLWNDQRAISQFVKLVRNEKPDLLFVQEGYEPWRTAFEWQLPEYARAAGCAHRHTCNTVIYVRGLSHLQLEGDGKGFAAAELWLGEGALRTKIAAASVHISRSHPKRAEEELEALTRELSPRPTAMIVAGDFNMSPWDPRFRKLQKKLDLKLHSGFRNSWPTHSRLDLQRKWLPIPGVSIDHVLTSDHFDRIGEARKFDFGSDHFAILVELAYSSE